MDTSSQAFESLLRAIHEAEYALPGPSLNIEATYVGDSQHYLAYPPPRDDPFTASGLRDPALGNTGPLRFEEIDAIVIHASPRHAASSKEYSAKFLAVAHLAATIPGVCINESGIRLGRDAA